MPKVQNTFLKGKMDSDTNYSLIGNDTYVGAEKRIKQAVNNKESLLF